MFVDQSAWPAAAALIEPGLRTIGIWSAGYLLLSLGLGLIWIALVAIAQGCQSRRGWNSGRAIPPRTATLFFGSRHWRQRDSEAFALRLDQLGDSLSAARCGGRHGEPSRSRPPLEAGS
jgi:hypothetical protein